MTYVNTLQERGVFNALRDWLIGRGFRPRALFWITGVLAFFLSPILDNLTTALVMGAVVVAVGAGNPRFIAIACVEHRCRGQCRRRFQPLWRYHDADGLAEGPGDLLGILCAVRALAGELAGAGRHHGFLRA